MNISQLYPHIAYNAQSKHCAFAFGNLVSLGTFVKNESMTVDEQIATFNIWCDSFKENFPKEISRLSGEEHLKRFTKLNQPISYRLEDSRLIIEHQSIPFSPALSFEVHESFLQYELHNGATPNLALMMYAHGLHALKQIYETYGIRTDILPSMTCNDDCLECRIPFVSKNAESEQISPVQYQGVHSTYALHSLPEPVSVDGYSLDVGYDSKKNGNFILRIPYAKKNVDKTNAIACDLFTLATLQSERMYVLSELQK